VTPRAVRRSGLVRAAGPLVRLGAVVALLSSAVTLAAGSHEYPGTTRPALRFLAYHVLPLAVVAGAGLAALEARGRRARRLAVATLAAAGLLLAATVPRAQAGTPPAALAQLASLALLVVGATGLLAAPPAPGDRPMGAGGAGA
jgi:peptidoglycan/LPS O-acetylase OafA/YrhL